MSVDCCPGCGERTFLMPLHGNKGGPLRCPLCVGEWNAKHGRRRKTGRVVIRAMMAFFDAGGMSSDIDKLKRSALFANSGFDVADVAELSDPLGYMSGIARIDGADVELLTSELLADVLRLTHPDHHPPEREGLARRVTQQLIALQPFVFPAPKPKQPLRNEPPRYEFRKVEVRTSKKALLPRFPCPDCASTVPYFYCDACKTEWDGRQRKQREAVNARQRKWYAERKARKARSLSLACHECGASLTGKRKDARFCSTVCRQKAHRATAITKTTGATLISRDSEAARQIGRGPQV